MARNRRVSAVSQIEETETVVEDERAEGLLGGKFLLRGKMTEQSTKLKLYVAFVKLNVAITEAARL